MKTEIVIEDGVELPDRARGGLKYPFAKMQVGQSFFIPKGNFRSLRELQASLVAVAYRHAPMKFTTRQDKEHDGVRVWRIE